MTSTIELLLLFLAVLAVLTKPVGLWLVPVAEGRAPKPVEAIDATILRMIGLAGAQHHTMSWKGYAAAMLTFNVVGLGALYALLRLQGVLPWNPLGLPGMPADQAFNTAVSFVTNTNWQSYAGEASLSPLSQALGLTVQNFVSAATGICAAMVLIRAFARRPGEGLGNFWADLLRVNLWVLLPLSFVFALFLTSQGVVQTWSPTIEAGSLSGDAATLAAGPVASQEAIKLLGTNGGGFFNSNSAHPFENPTALANFMECLAIFLISSALTYTFGRLVKDTRQGWTVWGAMAVLFVGAMLTLSTFEHEAGALLAAIPGVDGAQLLMEGKEVRFDLAHTSLFASVTTSASCGAVNAMHDSLSPLAGAVPTLLMLLGEVVFGGVGAGFYGMMVFIMLAVFISGLMVGRTPEYLGRKIDARAMKLACLAMLVTPIIVLLGSAASVVFEAGQNGVTNPGPHGFSQVLYAWASAANNNGSAFAGLGANALWYNVGLGLAMWFGRWGVMLPMLALAGLMLEGRRTPASSGTLQTHGFLFGALLVGVVVLIGALTYLPALALGPVAEYLTLSIG